MLWSIDNLLNAMINPVYLLIAGGLAAFEEVEEVCDDGEDAPEEEDSTPESSESGRGSATYIVS